MRRLEELDALRGLMLVWITGTHLPTPLSTYVNQPLGYVSAAEGFIFLSALFTGFVYFRMMARDGWLPMRRRLWARAGRLYVYHLCLLALAFTVLAALAAQGHRPAVHNLLDFYFAAGPVRASVHGAAMIYRPPLLDILPIYIILIALTPVLIRIGTRIGWAPVLAVSAALWLLAQFGLHSVAYAAGVRAFGLQVPPNAMGAFDVWAWQLCWVAGLSLGVRWAGNDLGLERHARRMVIPAAVIAAGFLALRYAEMGGWLTFGSFAPLLDKWHFGVGRIVDFAALAALAIRFRSVLKPLAIRPLVVLGQASLPVFCAHLVCVLAVLTAMGDRPFIDGWQAVAAIAASIVAMLVTARVAGARRRQRTQPVLRAAA